MGKYYKLDREDSKIINNIYHVFRIVYVTEFIIGDIKVKVGDKGGYISDDVILKNNVYVDKNSVIYGYSEIGSDYKYTTIESSEIVDSTVLGSYIKDSTVYNSKTFHGHIFNSTVKKSDISDSEVDGSTVKKSNIKSSYCRESYFYDAIINDFHIQNSTIKYSEIGIIGTNSTITKSTVLSLVNKRYINIHNGSIDGENDLVIFDQQGSRNSSIYFYTDYSRKIMVSVGCFNGTLKDFETRILIKYFSHNTDFMKYFKNYTKCIEIVKLLKPKWTYKKINIFNKLYYKSLFYFSDEQYKANNYIQKHGL